MLFGVWYRVVLRKCHENVRNWLNIAKKWPKSTLLYPKLPKMTCFDPKTTWNHVFRPKKDLKIPYFAPKYDILGKPPCSFRNTIVLRKRSETFHTNTIHTHARMTLKMKPTKGSQNEAQMRKLKSWMETSTGETCQFSWICVNYRLQNYFKTMVIKHWLTSNMPFLVKNQFR